MNRSFAWILRLRVTAGAALAVAIFASMDAAAAPRKPHKPSPQKTETVEAPPEPASAASTTLVPKEDAPKAEAPPRAPVEPPPPPPVEKKSILSPPQTTWPVYVLGAVGIVGLGTAAVFGGLRANAEHSADVAGAALIRKGRPPSLCNVQPVEVAYAEICAHLQKNKRMADSHATWVLPSLIVGAAATVGAFAWLFFAPKESEHGDKAGSPRVVPWVGASGGGASVVGRF